MSILNDKKNPWGELLLEKVTYENKNGELINPINRDYSMRSGNDPFRYIIIDNFLKYDVHSEIRDEFQSIPIDSANKYKGLRTPPPEVAPMFVEYEGDWHDAYRTYILPEYDLKMKFFLQRDYLLFIESFWPDIEFTNEIFMDVHHHRQFSRDGFVHNDFDPSEFSQNYYRGSDVGYKTCGAEACDNPDPNARYVQKSMACIYYVGDGPRINKNEPAGGHTAFFKDSKIEPFGGVEPVENRLVMFEISPISFHASRTNNTLYRDAIFGWHHSEMDYMQKKYPNEDLCKNFRGNFQPSMDNSYGNPVK